MTDEQKILLEKIRVAYQDTPATRVICDETNNTQEDIENGVVNITIIPYKTLEHIAFEFVVTKDD
jgi:phage tail sheath protein FI